MFIPSVVGENDADIMVSIHGSNYYSLKVESPGRSMSYLCWNYWILKPGWLIYIYIYKYIVIIYINIYNIILIII